jgi:hypothetical protein
MKNAPDYTISKFQLDNSHEKTSLVRGISIQAVENFKVGLD